MNTLLSNAKQPFPTRHDRDVEGCALDTRCCALTFNITDIDIS